MMKLLAISTLLCIGVGYSTAFLFGGDCQVSTWSEWEGPSGFNQFERYRTILVPPSPTGQACPNLVQFKDSSRKITLRETATKVSTNFLRRSSQVKTRDLLVIIDSSGSIMSHQFTTAKKDIADLLSLLCPPQNPFQTSAITFHRAAAIVFSGSATLVFDFDDKPTTPHVLNGIKGIGYIGGSTCTGKAFSLARDIFQSNNKGVRNHQHVQKEVLIITDGKSNCGPNAIVEAEKLKNAVFSSPTDTVKIYGLMIGNFTTASQNEVKNYVSVPVGNHLFAVPGFDKLSELVKLVRQNTVTCAPITWK